MTPLQKHIVLKIESTGPITIAEYMSEALMNPRFGYYSTRDPFGEVGDFITAPEISQMFGELVGASIAQSWLDQGSPAKFALVELGPGRGTLMEDLLRATRNVPGFHDALQLHLVETSGALRVLQEGALRAHKPKFLDTVDDLPQIPCFCIGNEFFDALPIRQFMRAETAWREVMVGARFGELHFGVSEVFRVPALEHRLEDTEEGEVVEICPILPNIVEALGQRIADHGGAALFIDYGNWRSRGDTLQALRRHESVDTLSSPGRADLTAHVDFEAITRAGSDIKGLSFSPMVPQGVFLERLGITRRAQTLAQSLGGPELASHVAAHRRLTHPEEMGSLFKCLAMLPSHAAPFPGLSK